MSLARLQDIAVELANLYRELAELQRAEHEGKIRSFFAADEGTIQGRDRIASHNTLDLTLEIIKAKGEIAALQEERDMLRFHIKHRNAHASP